MKFWFFYFILGLNLSLNSLNLKHHKSFSSSFQKQLIKRKIIENKVFAILFDGHIVLIGALANFHNMSKILRFANQFSASYLKSKKVYNFMIYKIAPENVQLTNQIKYVFAKHSYIIAKNYNIFVMGHVVWVIGFSKTCYEKLVIKEILDHLKFSGKIEKYYMFLKYSPSKKSGFVYAHKI